MNWRDSRPVPKQRPSFLDAALIVLRESDRPLSTQELTDLAIRDHLINPSGATPMRSMSRVLYLNARSDSPWVMRRYEPGATRAVRGSVRWTASPAFAADSEANRREGPEQRRRTEHEG